MKETKRSKTADSPLIAKYRLVRTAVEAYGSNHNALNTHGAGSKRQQSMRQSKRFLISILAVVLCASSVSFVLNEAHAQHHDGRGEMAETAFPVLAEEYLGDLYEH